MAKPSQLIYMAVDGVAPRAKMNQQRARRYKSAQENQDKRNAIKNGKNSHQNNKFDKNKNIQYNTNDSLKNNENDNIQINEINNNLKTKYFDSNCITPGTEFMTKFNLFFIEHIKHFKS
mmetsp:Transcript_38755/g.32713  ORF Transcript_38755/g.32713 Transcript_38755/m.32713 type:complete len:119 (-) Transcript_38755:1783-2139(-)